MVPFERNINAKKAFDLAETHLRDIAIPYLLTQKGTTGNTWTCSLKSDSVEKELSGGHGKGDYAKTGAIFEALEHFYTMDRKVPQTLKSYSSVASIVENSAFKNAPYIAILKNYLACTISTRKYFHMTKPDVVLHCPLVFSSMFYVKNPYEKDDFPYEQSNIMRYASNNGTAIGTSKEEACLHAINELIERDSLSLFLCRHFLYDTPFKIKAVSAETLPSSMQKKVNRVSTLIDAEVYILCLENDFNQPAFVAVAGKDNESIVYQGFGCSGNAYHAIDRCISELLQGIELQQESPENLATVAKWIEKLRYSDKLYRVAKFDILSMKERFLYIDYKAIPSCQSSLSVKESLDNLLNVLHAKGFDVYESSFMPSNNICMTNIFIPHFENFQLVLSGSAVVPGSRGLAYKKYAQI